MNNKITYVENKDRRWTSSYSHQRDPYMDASDAMVARQKKWFSSRKPSYKKSNVFTTDIPNTTTISSDKQNSVNSQSGKSKRVFKKM